MKKSSILEDDLLSRILSAFSPCSLLCVLFQRWYTRARARTYSRVCTRGIRATKGWKRALNAHLGKGVAFATVVDSPATRHTPLLTCLDEEKKKKKRIVDTREGEKVVEAWGLGNRRPDEDLRRNFFFFPREKSSLRKLFSNAVINCYYFMRDRMKFCKFQGWKVEVEYRKLWFET